MSDKTTTWELKLRDLVSAPLAKLKAAAGISQEKIKQMDGGVRQLNRDLNGGVKDISNYNKELKNIVRNGDGILKSTTNFKRSVSDLTGLLGNLEKRQKQALNPAHWQKYEAMIKRTRNELTLTNRAMMGGGAKGFIKQNFSELTSNLPHVGGMMGSIASSAGLAAAAIGLVVGGLVASTNIAMDFEKGMAKINTTAQLNTEQLGKLKTRLKDIGSESGGNFDRITSSYEKIISITGDVNGSLDITEIAVKGAKAGFADLDVVGTALARTMSAVGDSNLKAQDLLDTFMMAKNVGAGEFEDFANFMPGLISSANVAGYKLKDSVGVFTTLTKTFGGAEASMLSENVFSAFQKVDTIKEFEKAGIGLFKNGFRRPMKDVLLDLARLKKTMSPEQFTFFLDKVGLKDVQAKKGIGALIQDVDKLKTVFDGLEKSIGETNRQLENGANTARTWADVGDTFKDIGESIGSFLLPIIDWLGQKIKGAIDLAKKMFNAFTTGFQTERNAATDESVIKKTFQKKYGFSPKMDGSGLNDKQLADLNTMKDGMHNWRNNSVSDKPNNKTNDKTKDKLPNPANPFGDVTLYKDGKGGKGGSSSGAKQEVKHITMNLTVNNYFTVASHLKNKLADVREAVTDVIVDSGRDAVVAFGS